MLLLVISAFYYSLQFVFDCSIFVDDKSLLNYEEGTQAALGPKGRFACKELAGGVCVGRGYQGVPRREAVPQA